MQSIDKSPQMGVDRSSLVTRVAEGLREKIMRGEIKEGEQLLQDRVASSFNVSRIPVREALRQLEAEGLVTFADYRGAVVSSMPPEQIRELFELRVVVEEAIFAASHSALSIGAVWTRQSDSAPN